MESKLSEPEIFKENDVVELINDSEYAAVNGATAIIVKPNYWDFVIKEEVIEILWDESNSKWNEQSHGEYYPKDFRKTNSHFPISSYENNSKYPDICKCCGSPSWNGSILKPRCSNNNCKNYGN